jgi:hypothetical protein
MMARLDSEHLSNMKCANCERAAIFTVDNPGANPIDYCGTHLPERLYSLAMAGKYPLRSLVEDDELA